MGTYSKSRCSQQLQEAQDLQDVHVHQKLLNY